MINGGKGDNFFAPAKMSQSETYITRRQLIESKHEMVTGNGKTNNGVVEIKDINQSSYSLKRPNKLSWFRCVEENIVYNMFQCNCIFLVLGKHIIA